MFLIKISSDETLKNIHSGKEIKKLDGGNYRTENIVYAARFKIHGDICIGNTTEELRKRFSKRRYDDKNRPDNNEPAAHIRKYQYEFDKDIEVLTLKGNLYQKHERELWKDKFICLLGTKAPTGLDIELKHYSVSFMNPLPTSLHKRRNFYLISRGGHFHWTHHLQCIF